MRHVGVFVGRSDQVGPRSAGEDADVGAAVGLGRERDRGGVALLQTVEEAKLRKKRVERVQKRLFFYAL